MKTRNALKSDKARAAYDDLIALADAQYAELKETLPVSVHGVELWALLFEAEKFKAEQYRAAIIAGTQIDLEHQKMLAQAGAMTAAAMKAQ
jgi:hypothetical protein